MEHVIDKIEEKQDEVYEKKLIVVAHLSSINQRIYKSQQTSKKYLKQTAK